MGIPHRVVIGDRGLAEGKVEYKARQDKDAQIIDLNAILAKLTTEILA
jgi:prolyl-tRNA synthetase